MKNDARFEYVPWKMSDFVSFPLFGFTLVIKMRNLNLKVIKILQYFLIKKSDV